MEMHRSTETPAFEPRLGRSVSVEQAAQLLGVSRRTIYNRISDGRLQTIRTLGGSQRVLVESLLANLKQSTRGGTPAAAPRLGLSIARSRLSSSH